MSGKPGYKSNFDKDLGAQVENRRRESAEKDRQIADLQNQLNAQSSRASNGLKGSKISLHPHTIRNTMLFGVAGLAYNLMMSFRHSALGGGTKLLGLVATGALAAGSMLHSAMSEDKPTSSFYMSGPLGWLGGNAWKAYNDENGFGEAWYARNTYDLPTIRKKTWEWLKEFYNGMNDKIVDPLLKNAGVDAQSDEPVENPAPRSSRTPNQKVAANIQNGEIELCAIPVPTAQSRLPEIVTYFNALNAQADDMRLNLESSLPYNANSALYKAFKKSDHVQLVASSPYTPGTIEITIKTGQQGCPKNHKSEKFDSSGWLEKTGFIPR